MEGRFEQIRGPFFWQGRSVSDLRHFAPYLGRFVSGPIRTGPICPGSKLKAVETRGLWKMKGICLSFVARIQFIIYLFFFYVGFGDEPNSILTLRGGTRFFGHLTYIESSLSYPGYEKIKVYAFRQMPFIFHKPRVSTAFSFSYANFVIETLPTSL